MTLRTHTTVGRVTANLSHEQNCFKNMDTSCFHSLIFLYFCFVEKQVELWAGSHLLSRGCYSLTYFIGSHCSFCFACRVGTAVPWITEVFGTYLYFACEEKGQIMDYDKCSTLQALWLPCLCPLFAFLALLQGRLWIALNRLFLIPVCITELSSV